MLAPHLSTARSRALSSLALLAAGVASGSSSQAQCSALVPPPIPGVPQINATLATLMATPGCSSPFVLNLSSGVYNEQVVIPAGIDVQINGALPFGSSSVDGTGFFGPVVTLTGGHTNFTVLQNFAITNGSAFQGGGLFAGPDSRPILRNLSISGCTAQQGGGVFIDSSMTGATPTQILRMSRLLVRSNHADSTGGGIHVSGSGSAFGSPNPPDDIRIQLSDLSSNSAGALTFGGTGFGGALATEGGAVVHVDHTTLLNNSADLGGGAIAVQQSGRLRVTEGVFEQNKATGLGAFSDFGGGALFVSFADLISVVDSQFRSNSATSMLAPVSHGGHVFILNGADGPPTTYLLRNNLFVKGKATNGGGLAVYTDAPTDVLLCSFSQNSATAGGAIFSGATGTTLAPRIVDTAAFFDTGSVADPVTGSFEIASPNLVPSVSFSDIQHPGAPATYPGISMQNASPGWLTGYFCSYAPDTGFFLPQLAANPCFNRGNPLSVYPEIAAGFSTAVTGAPDTGRVDIGYHHLPTTCP